MFARVFGPKFRHELVVNTLAASALISNGARKTILRRAGVDIHPSAELASGTFFGGTDIQVGAESGVNCGCFFDNTCKITIGAQCKVAMEVMFCTSTHLIGGPDRRAARGTPPLRPIVVGDGCWLGARVTVLPGVTIASGCVIAAGAVVASDTKPDGLYAGVPAKRVRDLGANDASRAAAFPELAPPVLLPSGRRRRRRRRDAASTTLRAR